jgi:hypothetical protein
MSLAEANATITSVTVSPSRVRMYGGGAGRTTSAARSKKAARDALPEGIVGDAATEERTVDTAIGDMGDLL